MAAKINENLWFLSIPKEKSQFDLSIFEVFVFG